MIPVVLAALVSTKAIGQDGKKDGKAEGSQKPDAKTCKDCFGGFDHGKEGQVRAKSPLPDLPDGETEQADSARHF